MGTLIELPYDSKQMGQSKPLVFPTFPDSAAMAVAAASPRYNPLKQLILISKQ
jgi:hypothetical protein